jgi:hypothetical protein
MGKTLAMPIVSNYALIRLNAQPENYSALNERVLQYIRDNKVGDASLFVVSKGKGGGCSRRSDVPVTA